MTTAFTAKSNMNILLVCPQSGELVGKHPSFLPLGVAYIAAVLEKDGHRIEVLDLSVEKYNELTFQKIVCRGYHTLTPLEEFITGFFIEAIKLAVYLSAPMLLTGLVVGLLVSIFQAATSINEMTMTFIPKMLAVAVALIVFFPWMLQIMVDFTKNLIMNLPVYIR